MGRKIRIIGIIIAFSLLAVSCAGQTVVEVFDHYDVKITLDKGTAHIKETVSIKNVIDKPIVPGYAYITLKTTTHRKILGIPVISRRTEPVDVKNVMVTFEGNRLNDFKVTSTNESTTIRYGLWFPILPGENRSVVIEYDTADFVDRGILFTQGYYPVDASIPINNIEVTLELNDGNHVTYSNNKPVKSNSFTRWTENSLGTDEWVLKYEYSKLPLPTSPVRWSLVLWLFTLGTISVWSYRLWKPRI